MSPRFRVCCGLVLPRLNHLTVAALRSGSGLAANSHDGDQEIAVQSQIEVRHRLSKCWSDVSISLAQVKEQKEEAEKHLKLLKQLVWR